MSPPVTRLGIPVTFFAFVVTSLMFRAISANVGGTWCQLAVTQCPPFVTWVFLRVLGVTFVSVLVVTPRALFRATPINGSVTLLSPGVTWVSLCVLGVMCVPSQSLLSPLFRATHQWERHLAVTSVSLLPLGVPVTFSGLAVTSVVL